MAAFISVILSVSSGLSLWAVFTIHFLRLFQTEAAVVPKTLHLCKERSQCKRFQLPLNDSRKTDSFLGKCSRFRLEKYCFQTQSASPSLLWPEALFPNYTSKRPVSYITKSIFYACVDHCTARQGGFLCRDSLLLEGNCLTYRSVSRQGSCPAVWFSGGCLQARRIVLLLLMWHRFIVLRNQFEATLAGPLCCSWTIWSGCKSLCGSQGLLGFFFPPPGE